MKKTTPLHILYKIEVVNVTTFSQIFAKLSPIIYSSPLFAVQIQYNIWDFLWTIPFLFDYVKKYMNDTPPIL